MDEQPPQFYEPPSPELDALAERLRAEERDWNARVYAADRPGAADIAYPILGALLVMTVFFVIAYPYDRAIEESGFLPVVGCSFYLSGPIVALVIHRVMSRRRDRRAQVIAAHRDEALAPLRARLVELQRPEPLTETERRIQTLQLERDKVRRQLDAAYFKVEEARTSGVKDLLFIPGIGCGVFSILFIISMILFTNVDPYKAGPVTMFFVFFAPFVGLILSVVVPLIWRPIRRRARVAKLEAERDAIAPPLQQRLREIDNELAGLSP